MTIIEQLDTHYSTQSIVALANEVSTKPKKFDEIFQIFLIGEIKLQKRAAWALCHVAEKKPQLFKSYYPLLIQKLIPVNQHTAIYRSIFKCFQETEIPEDFVAMVFDNCLRFMMNEAQEAAVRAYAISTASKCAKPYPELQAELKMILNELRLLPQSKAVSVRLKRAMKDLDL